MITYMLKGIKVLNSDNILLSNLKCLRLNTLKAASGLL